MKEIFMKWYHYDDPAYPYGDMTFEELEELEISEGEDKYQSQKEEVANES